MRGTKRNIDLGIVLRLKLYIQEFLSEVIDGAVVYSGFTRIAQVLSGFFLLVIMTAFCMPAVQGYIFTFQGILGLQFVFDFGFSIALVNVVSHLWAHLELNDNGTIREHGTEATHLRRVANDSIKWFAYASVLFSLIVTVAGYLFFFSETILKTSIGRRPGLSQCLLAPCLCSCPLW